MFLSVYRKCRYETPSRESRGALQPMLIVLASFTTHNLRHKLCYKPNAGPIDYFAARCALGWNRDFEYLERVYGG